MGINVDLSKALHPRLLDVLGAFMPGFFFEICILVANPALVVSLMQPPLDKPLAATVTGVILAFIIGNFFMIWVSFVQRILFWLVSLGHLAFDPLWKKLLQYLLRAKGNPPRPGRFAKSKIVNRAYRRAFEADLHFRNVTGNWQRVAERTLKYYDIERPALNNADEWMPWMGIIGRFEIQDFRGPIILVSMTATGWSGLGAMHFAPRLHATYFLTFCFFLIGIGLLDGLRLASNLVSPEHSWGLGTLRAFEELKRTVAKNQKEDHDKQEEGEDGAP